MKGLAKLALGLSAVALLGSCAVASYDKPYVEPVQQVDNFNYDYDYFKEVKVKWYLQEAEGECGDDWSVGNFVEYNGRCYKLVSSEKDADVIYTEKKFIPTKGKFGEDRGESDRDETRESDNEQGGREDREADQER